VWVVPPDLFPIASASEISQQSWVKMQSRSVEEAEDDDG
jgi:hypothetical protein